MAYAEALKDKMALPDLTTVMNTRIPPPMVSARTSVKEAARLMKERRTTAVCVMEGPVGGINSSSSAVGSTVSGGGAPGTKIAGIFTSKDVVLRVIAAGLDPGRCSVVRVMTPHPDTALPTLSVQDALRKMHSKCGSDARYGEGQNKADVSRDDLCRWTLLELARRRV